MELQFQSLFSRETGNADNYRIPALITAGNRVIAVADERFFTAGDNPNRIDKVIRISDDSGNTWGKQSTIVEEVGESKLRSSAAIDPALLYASATDTLFLLYSHTPAGIGILNSRQTTGYTQKGQTLIGNGKKYYIKDHRIYRSDDTATDWSIDDHGYVRDSVNTVLGNVRAGDFVLREEPTSYLMLTRSTDGGVTWDTPVCLNQQVKKPNWGFIGAGPGIGIEVKQGKYKGRLVFPIYYGTHRFPPACNAAALYSDDNGLTWKIGEAYRPDHREWRFNPNLLRYDLWLTESQIVETPEGDLMAFIRNHNKCRRIATAISKDGGATWSDYRYRQELPHPICQISAIAFKEGDKNCVVTCNAADEKRRVNGVVRLSEDGGLTFPYSRTLWDGEFVYSSIARLPDGSIGIACERSTKHETIEFVKFGLDWIKGGNQ